MDRIILENISPIDVEGQYGLSFRAERKRTRAHFADASTIENFRPVPRAVEDKLKGPSLPINVFIKCPDPGLDELVRTTFLEGEFDSGTSINHAADRVERGEPSTFRIARMVGQGSLHQSGHPARPCLLYEHMGAPDAKVSRKPAWLDAGSEEAEEVFLTFAQSLARAVQVLHNQGIVHSFIVPRNIIRIDGQNDSPIAGNTRFALVGFGYARHLDAAARRIVQDLNTKEAGEDPPDYWFRAPECRGLADGSHATFGYPADIYSIGALLYALLLPKRITNAKVRASLIDPWNVLSSPPRDSRRLKRILAEALLGERALLEEQVPVASRPSARKLFLANENILKILDSCLRYQADQRFSCVEELLEAIEIAREANALKRDLKDKHQLSCNEDEFVEKISAFRVTDKNRGAHGTGSPAYFDRLKTSLSRSLAQNFRQLGHGHFEVYGHRDPIVTSLCRLLASAEENTTYRTMTLPDYWTDENLGSFGRFLVMNKHKVRKGMKIERLFLVSSRVFHMLPEEEQAILEHQLEAYKAIMLEDPSRAFDLRVLAVNGDEITDFERNGELVAYLCPSTGSREMANSPDLVCLNFFSTAKEVRRNGEVSVRRAIKKMRLWNPRKVHREAQFQRSLDKFNRRWNDATSLETYVLGERPGDSARSLQSVPTLQSLLGVPPDS